MIFYGRTLKKPWNIDDFLGSEGRFPHKNSNYYPKFYQDGAKISQDGAKMGQGGTKMGQDGPSWPQDGAKLAPRWAQDGPSWAQDGSKDAFPNTAQTGMEDGQRMDRGWTEDDRRPTISRNGD